ncbi:MAG: hypothetical protein H5T92_06695 [Synergistales bacterium]|nr:hypothetical protein [Synergistales bacterium]
MAGDWIKWCKGLHRKKEVIGIAARLGITPVHAAGLCMVFWEWLDDNISEKEIDESGNAHLNLGALEPAFIDRLVGADGFAAALAAEGWLNIRFGSLTVPNFTRHNQTGKIRALNAERVSRYRAKSQKPCNGFVTLEALQPNNNDDDVVERTKGKGGMGERGPPAHVTPQPLHSASDPDPELVLSLFRQHGRVWGGGPVTRRDRVLLWRVCHLAAAGLDWASAALESLAHARPANPGAYLQKLVVELGPRDPNVAVVLAGIPVPEDISAPPRAQMRAKATETHETPLSPEEGRAMVREVLAILKPNAAGNGKHETRTH